MPASHNGIAQDWNYKNKKEDSYPGPFGHPGSIPGAGVLI